MFFESDIISSVASLIIPPYSLFFLFLPWWLPVLSGLHHSLFMSVLIIPQSFSNPYFCSWKQFCFSCQLNNFTLLSPVDTFNQIHVTQSSIFLYSTSSSPWIPIFADSDTTSLVIQTQNFDSISSLPPDSISSSFTLVSLFVPSFPSHCYYCVLAEPFSAIVQPLKQAPSCSESSVL